VDWAAGRPFGSRYKASALFSETTRTLILILMQEGYLAEHAVSEEDRQATQQARLGAGSRPDDPMQGLEGLDVAGPRPE